jgi:hypothetical protein
MHRGEVILSTIRRAYAGFISKEAFRFSGLDIRNQTGWLPGNRGH